MAVSEDQLQTWSHQGSVQQSAATYDTIRRVLNDPKAPYARRDFAIFLQGSYGNSTNVWAESDVDMAICLTSTYYYETNNLDVQEKTRFEAASNPATYQLADFKREVTDWLKGNFGNGVTAGNKAIFVPGGNGRRDADVLACAEHRDYYSYPAYGDSGYYTGICFWTSKGDKIVNYPKQHMANCTSKQRGTNDRFKPNIRVVKNMRNAMIDGHYIDDGVAPSYFIEGMLYNVPNQDFTFTLQQSVENALSWLERCDPSPLVCANERHYLIRDGYDICWNMKDFRTTMTAMRQYWNSSGR